MYNDFCKAVGEFLIKEWKSLELLRDSIIVHNGGEVEEKQIPFAELCDHIDQDSFANSIVATGNIKLIDEYFDNSRRTCYLFLNILMKNGHYDVARHYLEIDQTVTKDEIIYAIQRKDQLGLNLMLKFYGRSIDEEMEIEAKKYQITLNKEGFNLYLE